MTTQQILQGVHDWTNGKIVYDISVAHPDGQGNPTPYANLTAALGNGGANIPEPLRKGGMSVKFIKGSAQSSDNNYVQYRYMGTETTGSSNPFLNTANWQGVDDEIIPRSNNLAKSGAVEKVCRGITTNTLNLNYLKSIIDGGNIIETLNVQFEQGKAIQYTGTILNDEYWALSNEIDVRGCSKIVFNIIVTTALDTSIGYYFYGAATGGRNITGATKFDYQTVELDVPEGATSFRFTWYSSSRESLYGFPQSVFLVRTSTQKGLEDKIKEDSFLSPFEEIDPTVEGNVLSGYYIARATNTWNQSNSQFSILMNVIPGEVYKIYGNTRTASYALLKSDNHLSLSTPDYADGESSKHLLDNPNLFDIVVIPNDCTLLFLAYKYGDGPGETVYLPDKIYKSIYFKGLIGLNEVINTFPESVSGEIKASTKLSFENSRKNKVYGINHRGYSVDSPENTIPAFRSSKTHGFHYIETDVRFTSDGVPVLLHDETVDRTSNGTGRIDNLTFNEVRQLDFGSWKGSEFAGTKIPSLEECLIFCRNADMEVYLHLKDGNSTNISDIINLIVNKYNIKSRVTLISDIYSQLELINSIDSTFRLGYTVETMTNNDIDKVISLSQKNFGNCFINVSGGFTDSALVNKCFSNNIAIEYHHFDDNKSGIISMLNEYPFIAGITSGVYVVEQIANNIAMGITP